MRDPKLNKGFVEMVDLLASVDEEVPSLRIGQSS
jgi:hypothetical protein